MEAAEAASIELLSVESYIRVTVILVVEFRTVRLVLLDSSAPLPHGKP